MPELPEVETTLRGISPHVQNQSVIAVTVRHRQLRWPIIRDLPQKLIGKKVTELQRRGKYLLLKIGTGTLIVHLGMSGSLRIVNFGTPPEKHDHVDIQFANKKILRYRDPRRFGAMVWVEKEATQHPLIAILGPEPLSSTFTGHYLWSQAQKRNTPIKSLIMENKTVVGVGNIYATEALFQANINPFVPSKSVPKERYVKLVQAIKAILQSAIKKGGTTLKDFVNSEGKPGYFSLKLKVYGRAGQPCVVCHEILKSKKVGQRTTTYCGECQGSADYPGPIPT